MNDLKQSLFFTESVSEAELLLELGKAYYHVFGWEKGLPVQLNTIQAVPGLNI